MPDDDLDREDIYVPDRFEQLRNAGSGALRSLVVPVDSSLRVLEDRFRDMRAARRGGLMVLRGQPGAGKSTFLDTVGLFRSGVVTERIGQNEGIPSRLLFLGETNSPRIIVVEGREALLDVSQAALETSMHAINTFARSPLGRDTLVVWPTNTDDLAEALIALGQRLGGDALLGVGEPIHRFVGPNTELFVSIAERTVAALNQGASLAALGIADVRARELAKDGDTIGTYLAILRRELLANGARVRSLMAVEQFRMWAIVIAGNDAEGDVAALTRGGSAYADIDRLMTSTGANIVEALKKEPDTLGILGTVLDAKVLNLDVFTALAISRQYADDSLRAKMRMAGMSVSRDNKAQERVKSSELGLVLRGSSLGTRRRGQKPGGSTKVAFEGLSKIARTDDGLLNRAIGEALVDAGLVSGFQTERPLGTRINYISDLYVTTAQSSPIRMEMMWRTETSRAEIANYVLGKLGNYAKAIGLLQ